MKINSNQLYTLKALIKANKIVTCVYLTVFPPFNSMQFCILLFEIKMAIMYKLKGNTINGA